MRSLYSLVGFILLAFAASYSQAPSRNLPFNADPNLHLAQSSSFIHEKSAPSDAIPGGLAAPIGISRILATNISHPMRSSARPLDSSRAVTY